jgi:CBS domain-containing protein/sporulation protein YlmC with PRC-barrel domain
MVHKFHLPTPIHREARLKELRGSLISLAGILGRSVVNQEGQQLGSVEELVCRWDSNQTYPPLTGMVIKVAGRKVWLSINSIYRVKQTEVLLNSAKLDLRDFKARPGEVSLNNEVLDRQLIDVDGARVVRASDLYIAPFNDQVLLVGVDVGIKPLLRRLGPRRLRVKVTPGAVIDWSTIQSFGAGGKGELKLYSNRQELRRMRPGELADLLEDLGRKERQELLNALSPDLAADALEEMEPKELESLLRESSPEEGSNYLANMEPDEAADALRDLDSDLQDELLKLIPKSEAKQIKQVLNYDEETAGGIMTTDLIRAKENDKVSDIKASLSKSDVEPSSLSAIAIISSDGRLVYDLPIANIILASDKTKLKSLIKPPATVTVLPDASLKRIAELLIESRSSSIVVVDENEKPLGRILADDLLDMFLPTERFHFPRLLSS